MTVEGHIRSHRLFHDDVPNDAPELPAKPHAWELTPAEILSLSSEGCPAFRRRMDGPVGALGKISASNLREYVVQQNAMDAPFQAMKRERFSRTAGAFGEHGEPATSARRARGEGSEAQLLAGLVTSKTSDARRVERIEIDRIKSRISRLQKAVKNGAHALDSDAHISGSFRWRRLFLTLTYRDGDDWSPKHIAKFAKNVRDWFRRHAHVPFRMQWVLELQKRGAVHYHCMIWIPARLMMPTPDKQGWWAWGSSNVKTIPGGIQRPVSYMSKYCSKVDADQCKRVPKGARMHGCNGLNEEGARWVRWWRAPVFAREALGGAADIRKVKGGYMDRSTGEFHESPWKVSISPGGRVVAWRIVPQQSTEVSSYAH